MGFFVPDDQPVIWRGPMLHKALEQFLVDAYCGSGLFALACARAFERVAGIEVSDSSVSFARENAAANGIGNASFTAGDASSIFSGLEFPSDDTVVVIDPPRKGCDGAFLRQLFAFGPRAVVYVSCDPATLARDLAVLTAQDESAAKFEIRDVYLIDIFPQTYHMEALVRLERRA